MLRFLPIASIPSCLVAPLGNRGVSNCANSGLTIPECSCDECLEGQIRRYRPSLLGAPLSNVSGAHASKAVPDPAAHATPELKAA